MYNKQIIKYYEARDLCIKHGIRSKREYIQFQMKNSQLNLHSAPDKYYKVWENWYDYLGQKKPIYLSYVNAKKFCKEKNIKSYTQYRLYRALNNGCGLPSLPDEFYINDWISWYDFLDSNLNYRKAFNSNYLKDYYSYQEAKEICKEHGIKSKADYEVLRIDIVVNEKFKLPSDPQKIYKNKWISWYEFFDKKIPNKKR